MQPEPTKPTGLVQRSLAAVERIGNRLPDPAVLFIALLFITWLLSWALSWFDFGVADPRNGEPLQVVNQLSPAALTAFFASMVKNFAHFHPIGVVLVAMLGIGVAEHTGFIHSALRAMLRATANWLLTPMIILVGIVSHTAADAGYVLVIPLGGVIFYAAGRHPLAGIAAAFAGVSGGFSANFIPSAIDPMLQGISQSAAQILDQMSHNEQLTPYNRSSHPLSPYPILPPLFRTPTSFPPPCFFASFLVHLTFFFILSVFYPFSGLHS